MASILLPCRGMADIPRISVEDSRRKTHSGEALLVCVYDDAKCRKANLDGSIPLSALETRAGTLPKSQELIFYCA